MPVPDRKRVCFQREEVGSAEISKDKNHIELNNCKSLKSAVRKKEILIWIKKQQNF
jgi:hypothetical protein